MAYNVSRSTLHEQLRATLRLRHVPHEADPVSPRGEPLAKAVDLLAVEHARLDPRDGRGRRDLVDGSADEFKAVRQPKGVSAL